MNRQKLVLCVLLLVLAAAIVYAFVKSPRQQQAAPGARPAAPAPARPVKKGAPESPAEAGSLHLERLAREFPRFAGYKRNIFSPIFKEEVKLPPFKPLPPPPPPVKQPPVVAPPAVPPPPPPPPPPPTDPELGKFTFLGFLKKGGERTVFLTKNNEIFLAKKGASLDNGKYQVADLTDEAITIKSVAVGTELVIPLVDAKSLTRKR